MKMVAVMTDVQNPEIICYYFEKEGYKYLLLEDNGENWVQYTGHTLETLLDTGRLSNNFNVTTDSLEINKHSMLRELSK